MSSTKRFNVSECSDAYCAMEKSGTNFTAVEQDLMTVDGISVPEHKGIYNSITKDVLSVMGKDYVVFQPTEIFALADTLGQEFQTKYSEVNVTDNGRIISIVLNPSKKDLIMLPNGDALKKQIRVTGSFDGSTHHSGYGSLLRSACRNLMIWTSIAVKAIKIRHTKNARDRVEDALRIWSTSQDHFKAYEETARILAAKVVNTEMVNKFLDDLVGEINQKSESNQTKRTNQRNKIENLFRSGRGNHGETAWDLYNGASEYYDHFQNVENPDAQLTSILYGNGAKKKTQALELALAL